LRAPRRSEEFFLAGTISRPADQKLWPPEHQSRAAIFLDVWETYSQ
jgi:hypothetical protein